MNCPHCGQPIIAFTRQDTGYETRETFVHFSEPAADNTGEVVIVGCERHTNRRVVRWKVEDYRRSRLSRSYDGETPAELKIVEGGHAHGYAHGWPE